MNIVAVDPGKTCGITVLDTTTAPWTFESAEALPWDSLSWVARLAEADRIDLVACESFTPRPGVRTWQPDALEIIGALRFICTRYGVPFELQSPADAKRFSSNKKLATVGWRNPTAGGHADDAARHLLLAAVRHDVIDPAQFI